MSRTRISGRDSAFGANAAVDALVARSVARHRGGQSDEALRLLDDAIRLAPAAASAHYNRGIVLHDLGRLEQAVDSYGKAAALDPTIADAYLNRGLALAALGRNDDALVAFDRLVALNPSDPEALNNRGVILHELGRLDEALACFETTLAWAPGNVLAYANLGRLLKDMKRPEDAIAACNEALKRNPDLPGAICNRALCKLALGDYVAGFADYEARHRLKSIASPPLPIGAPEWRGEALGGRAILVRAEQGMGDVFQFARYLPLIARAGADVIFVVQEKLHLVLAGLGVRLVAEPPAGVHFDYQCALLSLPYIIGTTRATIPASVPYLSADPARVALWRARIGDRGFRVGVCWSGGPKNPGRAFPPAALEPLERIAGVRLVSLQREDGPERGAGLPPGMVIESPGPGFDSGPDAFADCAAVIQSLDVVVSCDTAVAHLAGALARPTWLALRYAPDWRWMLVGNDTPWYPTMRLLRQRSEGDWSPVFEEMAARLAAGAAER
jgi:tetratricopeptide (TPR) repeat protein